MTLLSSLDGTRLGVLQRLGRSGSGTGAAPAPGAPTSPPPGSLHLQPPRPPAVTAPRRRLPDIARLSERLSDRLADRLPMPMPSPRKFSYGRTLTIGRAPENDVVLGELSVAQQHARFVSTTDGRLILRDLGGSGGTYVNGGRIPTDRPVLLDPGDRITVGRTTFRISGNSLEPCRDDSEATFWARHLSVTASGKRILSDVSFRAPEKSLVAVIGPSGSGKSTLLKALTGYRPADEGEVIFADRDLTREYADLRDRIGIVPQDDILHTELSVDTALRYAAELRFPGDTPPEERQDRIDEVLRELRLDVHRDKRISRLSGGQRKRVSVALELLTKPSLLLLDEPTSGLDPGMDRDVMQLLRALADGGRTVVVVTHSVAELALCDQVLVMSPGGTLAYAGPPEEALEHFGKESWADVFSEFENDRDADWRGRWRSSALFEQRATTTEVLPIRRVQMRPGQAELPQRSQPWGQQYSTLVRRYLAVIRADRGFLGLLVLLPVVIGLASLTIKPGKSMLPRGFDADHILIPNDITGTIMQVLAVGICFTGAANAVRELIKERVIYERERATGLSRSAYLLSKVTVLGAITAVQAVVLVGIALSIREVPGNGAVLGHAVQLEIMLAVVMLGLAAMVVGLGISAVVTTSERTMPLLVMFAILQTTFSGTLYSMLGTPTNWFSYLMPARWGVAAMGTSLSLNRQLRDRDHPRRTDWLWEHSALHWWFAMSMLLLLTLVLLYAVWRLLRRHEPEVMRA